MQMWKCVENQICFQKIKILKSVIFLNIYSTVEKLYYKILQKSIFIKACPHVDKMWKDVENQKINFSF